MNFLKISLSIVFIMLFKFKSFSQNNFTVDLKHCNKHIINVSFYKEVEDKNDSIILKFPTWTPGSYLIREFTKNITFFETSSNSNWYKKNKNTFIVIPKQKGIVKINYKYYAFELSVRTSYLDNIVAILNPLNFIPVVNNNLKNEYHLFFLKPKNKNFSDISTTLSAKKDSDWSFFAKDYIELTDNPIMIGKIKKEFIGKSKYGTNYYIDIMGEGNYNLDTLKSDILKICNSAEDIFKSSPNKTYLFQQYNSEKIRGGLEHDKSTLVFHSSLGFSKRDDYIKFLNLIAHEHFHLWNVRRLRPKGILDYDLYKENYLNELWFSEGFTSYYSLKILKKSNIITSKEFKKRILDKINVMYKKEGRKIQSLSNSSFDTWIKFYRSNENSNNSTISYYNKGAIIGFILDFDISLNSKYKKSLDDLFYNMYLKYNVENKKGFTNQDILNELNKLTKKNYTSFFDKYIYGTEPLVFFPEKSDCKLEVDNKIDNKNIGLVFKKGTSYIKEVLDNTLISNSGISFNDEVLSINGYRTKNKNDFEKMIEKFNNNDEIKLLISRRNKLIEIISNISKITKKEAFFKCKNTESNELNKFIYSF